MSKRSQEKRRSRAKEKAISARKARNASPISMLTNEPPECWTFGAAEETRMQNIAVFRKSQIGTKVAAFFLIDYDCLGIKDAFYVIDADYAEIMANYRMQAKNGGTELKRATAEEIHAIVEPALRWTRQNHFREPSQLPRCLTILGGEMHPDSADVSEFGDENGGLYYEGYEEDLASRLTDVSLEDFLARKDVTFCFIDGEQDVDYPPLEDAPDSFDLTINDAREQMLEEMKAWCAEQNIVPHPELETAIDAVCRMLLPPTPADGPPSEETKNDSSPVSQVNPEALEQVKSFLDTVVKNKSKHR